MQCTVCNSLNTKKTTKILIKGSNESNIFRCMNCTHRFLFTTKNQQNIIEQKYHEDYTGYRVDDKFERTIKNHLHTRFKPLIPPPASILDVGCGNGVFLSIATNQGYDVFGIDVSSASVNYTLKKGLAAERKDLLEIDVDSSKLYDFITMWDVLEHVRQPTLYLTQSYRLLKKDGYLVIKIPGFKALNFSVLKLFPSLAGVILGTPGHIQYFNMKSLKVCLEKAGFVDPQIEMSPGFRSAAKTRSIKKKIARLIRKVVFTLSANSNLYVFARKT